jgi:hypothetical protein
MGIDQVVDRGASKNLALLVFRVPDFIFWLKEGVLSMSYMLFFATPSSRPPTHWVFRGALYSKASMSLAQARRKLHRTRNVHQCT